MNRHSIALLMTICVVSLLASGLSHAAMDGSFSYTDNGTTIKIDRYYGDKAGWTQGADIVVPNTINGKPVTEIGNGAFREEAIYPSTLTLPMNLTTIGESAFIGCSGFTGPLTLPPDLTIINNAAFAGCSGFTGPLTIPESVTTIGWNAFSQCSGFTGPLIIPDGITTIENHTFSYCSGFTGTLTLPMNLTTIGSSAFRDCGNLTGTVTFPSTLTTMGDYPFYGCCGISEARFLGNAPTLFSGLGFCGSGFKVTYRAGSTGFTVPPWTDMLCEEIPNTAPRLILIGNKTIKAGQPITFTIQAVDDEGNALTYSASGSN